jgi:hypothetical protein
MSAVAESLGLRFAVIGVRVHAATERWKCGVCEQEYFPAPAVLALRCGDGFPIVIACPGCASRIIATW